MRSFALKMFLATMTVAAMTTAAVACALGNVDSNRRTLTTSPPTVAVGVTWLIALPARRTMNRRQNDTRW